VVAALAAWLLVTPVAVAQSPAGAPSSTHTRAGADGSATLRLANLRLSVPPGAVAPKAVVGLGAGGVPARDDSLDRSSAVVSAAGGLRAPVVLLIAAAAAEQSLPAGTTPILIDVADGTSVTCAPVPTWVACPVGRPGAYVLDRTTDLPGVTDQFLREAMRATRGAERGSHSRVRRVLAIVAVCLAAGAAVWLVTGRASGDAGHTE
jgi:hypothetical protein